MVVSCFRKDAFCRVPNQMFFKSKGDSKKEKQMGRGANPAKCAATRKLRPYRISLISKRLDERFQFIQMRFEIFLVIMPAANGAFIDRLGHIGVSGRAHQFLPRMFVKSQHARIPRNAEKIEGLARYGFQIIPPCLRNALRGNGFLSEAQAFATDSSSRCIPQRCLPGSNRPTLTWRER